MRILNNLIVLLALIGSSSVFGRHLLLRQMSPREVYRVLREAGREDAIPEGRIVTQAIAATSGFALGVGSGIGGALLYDLATSNATAQLLSNLQGYNMTAVASLLTGWTNSLGNINLFPSSGSTPTIQMQTQEICFTSRSLNDVDNEGELLHSGEGRDRNDDMTDSIVYVDSGTSPLTYEEDNDDDSVTGGSNGSDTHSETLEYTEETPSAETCVVIEKPSLGRRRRRRRHAERE